MAQFPWSGYVSSDSIASTNLNSLADGAGALTDELDNSVLRSMYADVTLVMGSSVTATGLDARADIYLIPAYNGTSYPNPGAAGSTMTGTFNVGTMSSVETVGTVAATPFVHGVLRNIVLPPTKLKFGVGNELGAAFSSTVTFTVNRYNAADS